LNDAPLIFILVPLLKYHCLFVCVDLVAEEAQENSQVSVEEIREINENERVTRKKLTKQLD
jgi:hypothetical protein